MAKKETLFGPYRPVDVSFQALTIGRLVDRLCRAPGTYAITIIIPIHRRAPWQMRISRQELLRALEIGR